MKRLSWCLIFAVCVVLYLDVTCVDEPMKPDFTRDVRKRALRWAYIWDLRENLARSLWEE